MIFFHHVFASVNVWNKFGELGPFVCELHLPFRRDQVYNGNKNRVKNSNRFILGIIFRLDSNSTVSEPISVLLFFLFCSDRYYYHFRQKPLTHLSQNTAGMKGEC